MQNKKLDAAASFARRGYKVFPCAPGGKQPITAHGFMDATRNYRTIYSWWAWCPEANVAVATGEGVLVLDIDNAKGGLAWLARVELPATWTAVTGTGGYHLYFKLPAGVVANNTASWIAPGVDTRGDGGYIIVPPSVHPNGNLYCWREDRAPDQIEMAEIPAWLLAEALRPVEKKSKKSPPPQEPAAPVAPHAHEWVETEQVFATRAGVRLVAQRFACSHEGCGKTKLGPAQPAAAE